MANLLGNDATASFSNLARVGPVQESASPGATSKFAAIPVSNEQVITSLAGYVQQCYDRALTAKQHITERLLKCDRQRRGEYDPEKLAEIRKVGGSEVYLMLTDIKCSAAESWIRDVMLNAGERAWDVEPTPEPSLPNALREQIIEMVSMEAQMVQQQGVQVTREVIGQRMREIHLQLQDQMKEEAKRAAENMSVRIDDILLEANWPDQFNDLIHDFCTFPAAFVKGPIFRKKRAMRWGAGWTPVVVEIVAPDFERVSPYDIFPSPQALNEQDGYLCERVRYSLGSLSKMIGLPGYNAAEITAVMEQYRRGGLRNLTYGETERDRLGGRIPWYDSNEIIEGVEYWGEIPGLLLHEWGMQQKIDPYTVYPCKVIKIGSHVIYASLNPDPLGRRPYRRMCFEQTPGAFWGKALPEKMTDTQAMCNASGRALANNMGVASGPQVEVTVDRLPTGENVTQMFPWKVWQTTSDRTGGGQPAIRFFQPDMNAQPLLEVLQYFVRISDEVTGVPNYIYGTGTTGGAGRTASGLSMLMDNASKGIKQAILHLDRGINAMLTSLYEWLMMNDPDQSIKGDMQVVPSGIVGALVMDHVQEKRQQFLQLTSNPIDMQIMGAKGRASLLRQLARGLKMNVDSIVPSDEKIEQAMQGGGIPPEVMAQMEQLQQEVMQLTMQVQDKSEEMVVRREEIGARIEEARIRADAMIDSRIHESELRAKVEADARMDEARLHAKLEREKIAAKRDDSRASEQGRKAVESLVAPLVRQLEKLQAEIKTNEKVRKAEDKGRKEAEKDRKAEEKTEPVPMSPVQIINTPDGQAIKAAEPQPIVLKIAMPDPGDKSVEFVRDASGKIKSAKVKQSGKTQEVVVEVEAKGDKPKPKNNTGGGK
jgi:hypothetical protein